MILKYTNFVNILLVLGLSAVICMTILLEPVYASDPAPAEVLPFDIQIDLDGDGKPDELMAALEELDRLEVTYQTNPSPTIEAKLKSALEMFSNRLPFNENIRALQLRISEVHGQLAAINDTEELDNILVQLKQLEDELQEISEFAIVDKIVTERLDDRLNSKGNLKIMSQSSVEETQFIFNTKDQNRVGYDPLNQIRIFLPSIITSKASQAVFAPDPACQNINTPGGQADFASLQRGDLLFYKGNSKLRNFAYARKFSHIGMFNGPNDDGEPEIYESDAAFVGDSDGGPMLVELATYWNTQPDVCIALGHYDTALLSRVDVETAMETRQQLYGTNGETPYPRQPPLDLSNYWLNKEQDEKIYCSLLPWKIFDTAGVDVDSNDLRYHIWFITRWGWASVSDAWTAANHLVAPDEIYLHESLVVVSEGVNP